MKRIETTIAFNMATRVCGHLMEESTGWMGYVLAKDKGKIPCDEEVSANSFSTPAKSGSVKRSWPISRIATSGGLYKPFRRQDPQFHWLRGLEGFLKITRRQQMKTPVNARIAGANPKTTQSAWMNHPNRPKCKLESQSNAEFANRPAGSTE
jgi:hypothetical protein